jgi:hypothetical protein
MEFKDLVGKIITGIQVDNFYNEIMFQLSDGTKCKLFHDQDYCESVYIEDITGDIEDLLNAEILIASEDTNTNETPEGLPGRNDESFTWTFYNIATIKGHVTIRWYGESNGYYSEAVDFEIIND